MVSSLNRQAEYTSTDGKKATSILQTGYKNVVFDNFIVLCRIGECSEESRIKYEDVLEEIDRFECLDCLDSLEVLCSGV